MTISFVCPQGHPLTAPDEMAGKAGKCPHCQTRFLVPQLELDELEPEPTASPPVPLVNPAPNPSRGETITFICPNGHKLNGPPTLRGKLGLCPHCQTRFRIPATDEISGVATTAASHDSPNHSGSTEISTATAFSAGPPSPSGIAKQVAAAKAAKQNPKPPVFSPPPPPPPAPKGKSAAAPPSPPLYVDEVPPAEIVDDFDEEPGNATNETPHAEVISAWQIAPPSSPANPSRWQQLFGWFWSQRDARSVVDLRLKGGHVFQPAWYAASLSDSQFGVFGTQADDGAYDISLVPWDQIERVDVRGCEELPPDRFE